MLYRSWEMPNVNYVDMANQTNKLDKGTCSTSFIDLEQTGSETKIAAQVVYA